MFFMSVSQRKAVADQRAEAECRRSGLQQREGAWAGPAALRPLRVSWELLKGLSPVPRREGGRDLDDSRQDKQNGNSRSFVDLAHKPRRPHDEDRQTVVDAAGSGKLHGYIPGGPKGLQLGGGQRCGGFQGHAGSRDSALILQLQGSRDGDVDDADDSPTTARRGVAEVALSDQPREGRAQGGAGDCAAGVEDLT